MLVLASQSPRRKELLGLITHQFVVDTEPVDESAVWRDDPAELVQQLAWCKAQAVAARRPAQDVVLGADTVVVLEGAVLGKPRDQQHAKDMLGQLAGRTHWVYTGVCIVQGQRQERFFVPSQVEFAPMTSQEIAAYVATGEPMDKAGAYGIQQRGAVFIRGIVGDYYSVMGLPVSSLYHRLKRYPGIVDLG